MKDKAAAALVFEPTEPEEEEAPESEPEEKTSGKLDTLLGNAFDAFSDGDRAGFIASLKSAMRSR